MRLHRLEIAGFGPFAGRIEVDLDRLGADGLFLLHGETGAGKTTLLDAVAYALYGKVPGARGEVRRLRCDLAEPGTPTEVTLEFSVGGRRIVITRRPEYTRPKTRGVGMTTVHPSVSLRYLDGGPVVGLTRADEIGRVVTDLMGMSADQFFQVVLLPQGEFARFLRSDNTEREALLERLFDTGRFRTIEDYLAEARRRSNAAAAVAQAEVDGQLARLAEAAGLESAPADADDAWLAALSADLASTAAEAARAADEARAAAVEAQASLAAATTRDAATAKLLILSAEQAGLTAGAAAHEAMLLAIRAAERAQPVAAAERAAQAAARDEMSAVGRRDRARDAVPAGEWPELGVAGVHDLDVDGALFSLDEDGTVYVPLDDGPVIHTRAAVVRERAGALSSLVHEADVQDAERAELAAARAAAATLDGRLADLDSRLSEAPAKVAAADAAVGRARTAIDRMPGLRAAVVEAEAVLAAARAVARLTAELTVADDAVRIAVERHQRAVDARQRLVDQRISDMAGELAAGLRAGQGCPVCGSAEHPRPATRAGEPVDGQALQDARSEETMLAEIRARAQDRVATLRAELAGAAAIAQGSAVGAAEIGARAAAAALIDATEQAEALPELERALATATGMHDELARARSDTAGRRQGLAGSIGALDASTAARHERLSAGAAPFATVVAHRDHLVSLAALLDDWAQAADDLDRARAHRRRAEAERAKAVAEAGFASLADALRAADLDLEMARATTRDREARAVAVAARLADPDLADADPDGVRIDLAAVKAGVAAVEAAREAAVALATAATARCRQVELAAARVAQARSTARPLVEGAARLAALADTVAGRGQNHRSMSLRSYVLAARLRQVAAVAGQRLKRMSDGRYEFVHSQEKESRGRSGGLGLDILDGYTGVVRPAKTLSGGESFLASLALALGLADVVAAESGGRLLDTIVIDEGFGSLDSDTLELVMATLDDLRAGGRVVGIVSHVDELRQRIPSRLRVRKGMDGSTIEVTT
jgi:exonuclease SbcC